MHPQLPPSAPAVTRPPVYLEFRNLTVALKSRHISEKKKPTPIETIRAAAVIENPRLQPVGACSTVSPPILSSSSPPLGGSSTPPNTVTSVNTSSSSSSSSSSPPCCPSTDTVFIHASGTATSPLHLHHTQQSQDAHHITNLPTPPEFSFIRPHPSALASSQRDPASEPTPTTVTTIVHTTTPPGARMRVDEEEGEPEPNEPVMVFHSQPSSIELLAQDKPELIPPAVEKIFILDNISGFALPGQVTAIIGASGSGKTTLLNILSGRHSSSSSRLSAGSILINGSTISSSALSQNSAFVQQNDLLLPYLTVREIIHFAAMMKLPQDLSLESKEQRVSEIIEELGLMKCEHFMVGSSGAGEMDVGGSQGSGGGGGGSNAANPVTNSNSSSTSSSSSVSNNSKTTIGISRSGISGGEQRRVSIGMELVTDPQLLFLDEPSQSRATEELCDLSCLCPATSDIDHASFVRPSSLASGLDSSTAYTIVNLLKHLALNRGRTIILTIHSPSSKIFTLFDRLILLTPYKNGAKIAYQGSANQVMEYFERLNLGMAELSVKLGRSMARMTVSDYLMTLLQKKSRKELMKELEQTHAIQVGSPSSSSKKLTIEERKKSVSSELIALVDAQLVEDELRIGSIVTCYDASPDRFPDELLPQIHGQHDNNLALGSVPSAFHPGSSYTISWLHQLHHLTYRTYLTHVRELTHMKARVFTNVFLALFVGLLYFNPSQDISSSNYNQRSIFNRVGFIFFVTCMQALITLVNSVLTFTEERALFLREKSSKMYATSAYFLSKMIIELPLNTVLSFMFGLIGYSMSGMNVELSVTMTQVCHDFNHFMKFLFLLSLLGHAIAAVGLFLGCLIHIPIVAVMLCPITVIPFMLTSGFFINLTTIPAYLSWLTVLSPHRYTFAGLMGLEFVDLKLHCDASEMSSVLLSPNSPVPESFQYCSLVLGKQVLDLLDLPYQEYWMDVGALILLSVGFRLLAFVVLECSVRENRLKLKEWRRKWLKRLQEGTIRIKQQLIQ